ncbi:Integral membrane protein [Rhynchospora pubera]|uniref:Integral membrane protein n=1 Tax=Rhynchospora pubera TaxID=906938 RepID=A0AAV8C0G0_9POAL|nr:Integral membrane protein [Rhynchospora pubera]
MAVVNLSLASSATRVLVPPTTRQSTLNYNSPPISLSPFPLSHSHASSSRQIGRCARALGTDRTVYQGVYGPWSVQDEDVREVILYRSGLVTAATSFVLGATSVFLPEGNPLADIIRHQLDIIYIVGAGGLGLSLVLIHIYVTAIKRFLQALWVLGVIGSIGAYFALAQLLDEGLVEYVVRHPVGLWLVGPVFAALTGLVFKEGLCYGKLEAGILTFIIPGLLLGHLSGLMDDGTKVSLLGVWMALFVVFAARKFQQPIKDDIGDKSVFMFNALPEEEKKALLEKLDRKLGGAISRKIDY